MRSLAGVLLCSALLRVDEALVPSARLGARAVRAAPVLKLGGADDLQRVIAERMRQAGHLPPKDLRAAAQLEDLRAATSTPDEAGSGRPAAANGATYAEFEALLGGTPTSRAPRAMSDELLRSGTPVPLPVGGLANLESTLDKDHADLAALAGGARTLVVVASREPFMAEKLRQTLVAFASTLPAAKLDAGLCGVCAAPLTALRKLARKTVVAFPLLSDPTGSWIGQLTVRPNDVEVILVDVATNTIVGSFAGEGGFVPHVLVATVQDALVRRNSEMPPAPAPAQTPAPAQPAAESAASAGPSTSDIEAENARLRAALTTAQDQARARAENAALKEELEEEARRMRAEQEKWSQATSAVAEQAALRAQLAESRKDSLSFPEHAALRAQLAENRTDSPKESPKESPSPPAPAEEAPDTEIASPDAEIASQDTEIASPDTEIARLRAQLAEAEAARKVESLRREIAEAKNLAEQEMAKAASQAAKDAATAAAAAQASLYAMQAQQAAAEVASGVARGRGRGGRGAPGRGDGRGARGRGSEKEWTYVWRDGEKQWNYGEKTYEFRPLGTWVPGFRTVRDFLQSVDGIVRVAPSKVYGVHKPSEDVEWVLKEGRELNRLYVIVNGEGYAGAHRLTALFANDRGMRTQQLYVTCRPDYTLDDLREVLRALQAVAKFEFEDRDEDDWIASRDFWELFYRPTSEPGSP